MSVLRKFLLIGCYFGLFAAAGFFIFGSRLRVHQIHCIQDGGTCPTTYLEKIQTWQGKSLLFTDFSNQALQLQKNWPELQKITVQKQLPDLLNVQLSLGQPAYSVAFPDNQFSVVSVQGLVIQELTASPSGVPIFNLPSDLHSEFTLGQKVEEQWQAQLTAFGTALALNKTPTQQIIFKNKTEVQLFLINNQQVFLLLSEAPTALPKLAAIEQAESNKQLPLTPKTIDLRFKYPVIKGDPAATLSAQPVATASASHPSPKPSSKVATVSASPSFRR